MLPQELLDKQRAELKRVIASFPKQNAQLSLQFFQARFREQGWRNVYFKAWKARSSRAKRNKGRAILIDTGRLRRSLRIMKVSGNTSSVAATAPYAEAHNNGFKGVVRVPAHTRAKYSKVKIATGKLTKTGKKRYTNGTKLTGTTTVKAHTKRMNLPRRQFMGESKHLTDIIKRKQEAAIKKVFNI